MTRTGGTAHRGRRARWGWSALAAFVLLLWCVLLFQSDWRVTDRLLGGAIADLREMEAAAAEADLDVARAAAGRARARMGAATERTDGPLWWALGLTSRYGPNLRAARHMVLTAHATAGVASTAFAEGGDLVTAAYGAPCRGGDGVEGARARLAAVDLTEVVAATARLREIEPDALPASLVWGREQVLELADTTITAVREAAAGEVC